MFLWFYRKDWSIFLENMVEFIVSALSIIVHQVSQYYQIVCQTLRLSAILGGWICFIIVHFPPHHQIRRQQDHGALVKCLCFQLLFSFLQLSMFEPSSHAIPFSINFLIGLACAITRYISSGIDQGKEWLLYTYSLGSKGMILC